MTKVLKTNENLAPFIKHWRRQNVLDYTRTFLLFFYKFKLILN